MPTNFCQYKYIVGAKKGQSCETFLRGGGEFCYKHKKFKKEPEVKPESVPIESKPVEEKPAEKPKVVKVKATAPPLPKQDVDKVIQLKLDDSSDSSDWSSSSDSSSYETSDSY